MSVMQKLGLAVFSLGAAAAMAAQPPSASAPSTGRQIVAPFEMFYLTQVEYCLRNVPELREELSFAHATYSVALTQAAEILSKRFPNGKVVAASHLAAANDERARQSTLKQIQALGTRPCGPLVHYMHAATGESLAKVYGDNFASLVRQVAEKSQ